MRWPSLLGPTRGLAGATTRRRWPITACLGPAPAGGRYFVAAPRDAVAAIVHVDCSYDFANPNGSSPEGGSELFTCTHFVVQTEARALRATNVRFGS
jgi:hypothetical protein